MPKEFQRENRYVVFKRSDMRKYLSQSERRQVEGLALHICLSREDDGKQPLNCLVIEKDWPEYEPTWKSIEARITGTQPAPSVPDIDYLVDTLSEFADHHVEHGQMSFDKWTLRSAVEAMLMHLSTTQPAPSVPECPYPCGWQNLLKLAIEDGAYLARSINEDEPVTENARAVAMRMVMQLRDVLMTINKASPEAKP